MAFGSTRKKPGKAAPKGGAPRKTSAKGMTKTAPSKKTARRGKKLGRPKLKRRLTAAEKKAGLGCFRLQKAFCDVEGGGRVLEPNGPHTHTLIFLHHLGINGEVWIDEYQWWLNQTRGLKVVLPDAPLVDSPYYKGIETLWFDYLQNHNSEKKSVQECSDRITDIVINECDILPANRVFLGGFSQGAAAAFHSLMNPRMPQIGGLFSACGTVMGLTVPSPAQFATPIRFDIPGKDWIYRPPETVRNLKRLQAAGFTDLKYTVHPGLIHETEHQRIWLNRFITEMTSRNPPREDTPARDDAPSA
jgi:predicted esterase